MTHPDDATAAGRDGRLGDGASEVREVRSRSDGGALAVELQSRTHRWTLDEPVADDGADLGPTPVGAFLGALLACMTVSLRVVAALPLSPERRVLTIGRVEGRVTANPQGHITGILLRLDVWSPEPEEAVRNRVERAGRACYVSHVLRPEIDYRVEAHVHPEVEVAAEP